MGQNEDCIQGTSISDSSEKLLQRGSGVRSICKIAVKWKLSAIKCLLCKRFSASHEELMSSWSVWVLLEICQENMLVIANTLFQQHKRRLNTWTSPDGQHRNQIDYILCSQRWRSSIQKQDQELTGSDHELLIAKFRLKLKKVKENH